MELKKRLKNVTYSRSYLSGRELPIVIVGNTRWARDIELLMEDQWTQLFLSGDENEFRDQLAKVQPRLCVIEYGVWNNSEKRLVEAVIPITTQKLIITPEIKDELGWRRLTKEIAQHSVPAVVLDPDPALSVTVLSDIFDGLINNQKLTTTSDMATLKATYEGFCLSGKETDKGLQKLARLVLSTYAVPATDLQATILLCDTVAIQSMPLLATSDVFFALQSIKRSIADQNCLSTLKLIDQIQSRNDKSSISEDEWKKLFESCGFGRLSIRQLVTMTKKFQEALIEKTSVQRLKMA